MIGTWMAANVRFVIIPGPERARRRQAGRARADPDLRPARQAALDPQQLPDAAGAVRDDQQPLPVHVRPSAGLAGAAGAHGPRRLVPPLLQPAPSGPRGVVDPRVGGTRRALHWPSPWRRGGDLPGAGRSRSPRRRRSFAGAACRVTRGESDRSQVSPRRQTDWCWTRPSEIVGRAQDIYHRAVITQDMPLGNLTGITPEERDAARRVGRAGRVGAVTV